MDRLITIKKFNVSRFTINIEITTPPALSLFEGLPYDWGRGWFINILWVRMEVYKYDKD